jgi:hypothetical protein
VPLAKAFEPPKRVQLVFFVRDSEPGLEAGLSRKLTQQVRAKRVDGAARDFFRTLVEAPFEPLRDFAGGFVGKRERADARGVEPVVFNEEPNAFGEAERLARAGARED